MTETTEAAQTVKEAGSMELIRVPAWGAEYRLSDNPEELAHLGLLPRLGMENSGGDYSVEWASRGHGTR